MNNPLVSEIIYPFSYNIIHVPISGTVRKIRQESSGIRQRSTSSRIFLAPLVRDNEVLTTPPHCGRSWKKLVESPAAYGTRPYGLRSTLPWLII